MAALTLLAAPAAAQDPAEAGGGLFKSRCASCHSLEPGRNRVGPSLAGVFGRRAGAVDGARYSPAMAASGIVWDAAALDAYLANPRGAVPGTTMPVGLPNERQRAEVVAFLQAAGDAPPSR